MTNVERVISALLADPGLSDSELRQRTNVNPHQQVNQICRRLANEGRLRRIDRGDGVIRNYLTASGPPDGRASVPQSQTSRVPRLVAPAKASASVGIDPPATDRTLLILPCSGAKIRGGQSTSDRTIPDLLDPTLRDRLVCARRHLRVQAQVDDRQLLPAWQRYSGTLYRTASTRIGDAISAGVPILIVSGGYGLVLAEEPIGWYERRFSLGDWPPQVLEDCLVAATKALKIRKVVAFCARSTDYAALIRRTPWSRDGIEAWLASPEMDGRGGAQVLVPEASGEAITAYLDGHLDDRWTSTRGVAHRLTRLA